ncbi:hypothetical protein BASA81_003480 [Batrachochytrium salamandrivorans]|nr:hypothetical protein BASA81_003480 [Batrachochytrium salamandrivorans]
MARKKASQLEKTFTSKTGHQPGVEMWRVEQVREGKDSTQEERDLANFKAIELFDFLNEQPIVHRERQGYESALFQQVFEKSGVHYLEGDLSNGFWHVKLNEFQPRLSVIKRALKTIRVVEILPPTAASLTQTDVFILDCGQQVYLYPGKQSSAFAKMKGASLVQNIIASRQGKSKANPDLDEGFWQALGGGNETNEVNLGIPQMEELAGDKMDDYKCTLYKMENDGDLILFTSLAEGKLREAQLDTKGTFLVDALAEVFVWVGKERQELDLGVKYLELAKKFLEEQGKPETTPVTRLYEGQRHHVFGSLMMPKAQGGMLDMNRYKKEAAKVEAKATPPPQQKRLF